MHLGCGWGAAPFLRATTDCWCPALGEESPQLAPALEKHKGFGEDSDRGREFLKREKDLDRRSLYLSVRLPHAPDRAATASHLPPGPPFDKPNSPKALPAPTGPSRAPGSVAAAVPGPGPRVPAVALPAPRAALQAPGARRGASLPCFRDVSRTECGFRVREM
nr:translation initiation factor IF-2-like isoform X2 [Pan paniscus]